MLQLKNTTPFAAQISVLPDPQGVDTLYVAIKATFSLKPRVEVAPKQVPLRMSDEYWGEPGASSLKYAADVHLLKPSTDIALVGQAWAPDGRSVTQLDVSLAVGDHKKTLRVFGERKWRSSLGLFGLRPSSPAPFRSMPLVYERACGGAHVIAGSRPRAYFEARNPVGQGFAGKRRRGEIRKTRVPNIEDPKQLKRKPGARPTPAGFGFIAASWEPRRSFAGTYDAAWLESRAPYLPKDFDARYFHAAHPDLVAQKYLSGGEPVEAVHVAPDGPLRFKLPVCELDATVRVAGKTENPRLNLETVLIESDDSRLTMLWRGATSCDKATLKVEEVGIAMKSLRLEGGV